MIFASVGAFVVMVILAEHLHTTGILTEKEHSLPVMNKLD